MELPVDLPVDLNQTLCGDATHNLQSFGNYGSAAPQCKHGFILRTPAKVVVLSNISILSVLAPTRLAIEKRPQLHGKTSMEKLSLAIAPRMQGDL